MSGADRPLEKAIAMHGKPEMINTDQGSQFTSDEFTGLLIDNDIQISMDGKGRATDNIFIESHRGACSIVGLDENPIY